MAWCGRDEARDRRESARWHVPSLREENLTVVRTVYRVYCGVWVRSLVF